MKTDDVKLIENAICRKWHCIAYGIGVSEGRANCPLCAWYYEKDCVGCPVTSRNNDYYKCNNTPCKEIPMYVELDGSMLNIVESVEKQIIFLCSLLPEDHKFYENFN